MDYVSNGSLNLVTFSFQDDAPAMDFVTAAANLRMYIFSMNMKSRFDVKCKCPYTFSGKLETTTYNFFFFFFCRLFNEHIDLTLMNTCPHFIGWFVCFSHGG